MAIKYLHTMVRVKDIDASLNFYCNLLGLKEIRRKEYEQGKFTLIFLAPPDQLDAMIELTYNWDSSETYKEGRNFGHLAFEVDDIYETCQHLLDNCVSINRPPRDGRMAFIRSPDNISIELLQRGEPKDIKSPWDTMEKYWSLVVDNFEKLYHNEIVLWTMVINAHVINGSDPGAVPGGSTKKF